MTIRRTLKFLQRIDLNFIYFLLNKSLTLTISCEGKTHLIFNKEIVRILQDNCNVSPTTLCPLVKSSMFGIAISCVRSVNVCMKITEVKEE